jgi:hypothetical protein
MSSTERKLQLVSDQPTFQGQSFTGAEPKIFAGGGGGFTVDSETKNYLDAKVDAVKAQNDARFTEVLSEIRMIKPGATWQQFAGLLFGAVTFVFAILAFSSDRFDGGLSAIAIKDQISSEQDERDAAQDARLDRIIDAIENLQPLKQP